MHMLFPAKGMRNYHAFMVSKFKLFLKPFDSFKPLVAGKAFAAVSA